jgi:hypothetical protein
MAHACEVANEAEKAIAIQRPSGFNKLYKAAVKKECDHQYLSGLEQPVGETEPDAGNEKGKAKERQILKFLVRGLAQENVSAWKWTWGVDLNEGDLSTMIRGADRNNEIPHSGYNQDLPSDSLQSQTSGALDPAILEDPNDNDLLFDDISSSIGMIPELSPYEIPVYSGIFLDTSGDGLAESEPDPVIEAFIKKRVEKKAKKMVMQDEVDQPVSYLDQGWEFNPQITLIPSRPWLVPHLHQGWEFNPQITLIPSRPWLVPHLPIIHPLNNTGHVITQPPDSDVDKINNPDTGENHPDHITLPDSEDDNLMLPDSDSSQSSVIHFPMSDDEDDVMDVVRSDEQTVPPGATLGSPIFIDDSDSESDNDRIIFPCESPLATQPSIGGSEVIERDPNTGHFSAASFSHFPDDLLD